MAFKGNYPCLEKAGEDEPIFVLRAQDKLAPGAIEMWADAAEDAGVPAEKVKDARELANLMRTWPNQKIPD